MQKWEYATITLTSVGSERKTTPSENIAPPEGASVFGMLEYLGEQGWELVATMPHTIGAATSDTLFLKRPKED